MEKKKGCFKMTKKRGVEVLDVKSANIQNDRLEYEENDGIG